MAPTSPIQKVAIVGATGRIGGAFATELLKTGKHTVTALTRADSTASFPDGAVVVKVNYDDEGSIVTALKGQQFLIITLSVRAPPDLHGKIVAAAAKAGVPHIMPNVFGQDARYAAARVSADDLLVRGSIQNFTDIERTGNKPFNLVCGFWYEWSLAIGDLGFGFDIKNRKVTFYDDGNTISTVSTWDQCGRAIAALLSLPESGAQPSLVDYKERPLYINSFQISQRIILDSLHRVLGTTDADWDIGYEPTPERYARGMAQLKQGDHTGFPRALYSKAFFKGGSGDHGSRVTLDNRVLGLPVEQLDFCTKRAVDMVESGWHP